MNSQDLIASQSETSVYSEMTSFFNQDFDIIFNTDGIPYREEEETNLIFLLHNQSNIKTFTDNRVMVSSYRDDMLAMVRIYICSHIMA